METKSRHLALAAVVAAIVGAVAAVQAFIDPPPLRLAGALPRSSGSKATGEPPAARGPTAPEISGIVRWLNSEPLDMNALRGKVVLVDFWTYSCINCQRTLPYLRDWHEKYAGKGLVILGIHSPEFEFEKVEANVREAVAREGVTWPVAMDNDFATWQAYHNRYWPHEFLVDEEGTVRYDHIGEGAYRETEMRIRELLIEAGADVSSIPLGRSRGA